MFEPPKPNEFERAARTRSLAGPPVTKRRSHAGSLSRRFAFSGTAQSLKFAYVLPDRDHLVLSGQSGERGAVVVRLRRIDPSTYTLVNWDRSWRW